MSDADLVLFEFVDDEAALLQVLAARLLEARTKRDDAGLRTIICALERVADNPGEGPE